MENVLLVEDSAMFAKLVKKKIETVFDVPVYWARTLAEAEDLLEKANGRFSAALLDFNLPDAPNGEIIDKVLSYGISSFVFTSNMTEEVRETVWSKHVADYILKEDKNSLNYIVESMGKLDTNHEHLILIVDDSKTSRTILSELLYVRKYRVINASSGKDALGILEKYPETKLVITDYNMPEMDGFTLCRKIREKHKAEHMAIIGISSNDDRSTGARFIKSGANDFIVKQPFLVEEFYARINDCLETIDLFAKLRDAAINDYLTGLSNRRHFFDVGKTLFTNCVETGEPLSCTMLDIDHFKRVNDTYGHDVGDQALITFSRVLRENSSELEVVSRLGGEEFCILTPGIDLDGVIDRFEELREKIAETPMATLEDGTFLY